jgi:segregation and condensation protein B
MGNREIVEALIFSSGSALSIKEIMKVLPGLTLEEIERYIEDLNGIYETSKRSFRINPVATGYMFVTLPEHASFIRQLVSPVKLTVASLEVLAVIAYKGPCSKQTIDGIRGVDSTSSLKQLLKHQLIDIKSGRPMMYYITDKFLEVFGLASLSELPDITQFEEVFGGN